MRKHKEEDCPFLHVKNCSGCGRSCACYASPKEKKALSKLSKLPINKCKLKAYQYRVIEEKQELASKMKNLAAFFKKTEFKKLDHEDSMLLHLQHDCMAAYLRVLDARIQRFK